MIKFLFHMALPVTALALASCGPPAPRANIENWQIARNADGKSYRVTIKGNIWGEGSWFPHLEYTDHNGCRVSESLGGVFPYGDETSANKDQIIATRAKIETARLTFDYLPEGASTMDQGAYQRRFDESRTVDPLPPGTKRGSCSKKPGTPETSFGQGSREENAAAMINMAGFLCGKVLDAYSIGGGKIGVHCTEYRDGRGRANYTIDTNTAEVTKTR